MEATEQATMMNCAGTTARGRGKSARRTRFGPAVTVPKPDCAHMRIDLIGAALRQTAQVTDAFEQLVTPTEVTFTPDAPCFTAQATRLKTAAQQPRDPQPRSA